MTFEQRVAIIAGLGFTPRQARFLTLVALHSGYCLRRQYATFAGLECGKNVSEFLERLVARSWRGASRSGATAATSITCSPGPSMLRCSRTTTATAGTPVRPSSPGS